MPYQLGLTTQTPSIGQVGVISRSAHNYTSFRHSQPGTKSRHLRASAPAVSQAEVLAYTKGAGPDMRVCDDLMSSDLPILNAEQYTDTVDIRPTQKAGRGKKSPAELGEEGPRKRAKTSSKAIVKEVGDEGKEDEDADADEDEKSKRARGRPRLDTKDQNAAEVGARFFCLKASHLIKLTANVFPLMVIRC